MKHLLLPLDTEPRRSRFWGALMGQMAGARAAILMLAVLAACGGGGDSGGPAIGGDQIPSAASDLTQGPIGGFGSIVVNGVRFDDSAAQVLDDKGGVRNSASLKLGMHVEIEHAAVNPLSASARAHVIRYGELVRGPVTAVDAAGGSLTVLGQKVLVRDTTVFDSSIGAGLPAVQLGWVVEIHGLFDASQNAILASRIERETAATSFKLRGAVASLDTTAKTFTIGQAAISYAQVPSSELPGGLANAMIVRVELKTAQENNLWVATEVKGGPTRPNDRSHAEVRGIVTAYTSSSQFSVNGIPVDASTAAFPDGSTGIKLGALVEVEGSIAGGVLKATKVELEDHHRGDDNRRLEFHGDITALNKDAKTLVLRDTTVRYSGNVNFHDGAENDLAVGRRIEVKGVLASDRVTVQATKITFEK